MRSKVFINWEWNICRLGKKILLLDFGYKLKRICGKRFFKTKFWPVKAEMRRVHLIETSSTLDDHRWGKMLTANLGVGSDDFEGLGDLK